MEPDNWDLTDLGDHEAHHAEIARLRAELVDAKAYADKLAAGLPEGMLPKDVENMRAANWQLAAEVERLKAAQSWIPAGKRLPEIKPEYEYQYSTGVFADLGHGRSKVVLVKRKDGINELAECDKDGSFYHRGFAVTGVTHWMPLPEPPQIERKE